MFLIRVSDLVLQFRRVAMNGMCLCVDLTGCSCPDKLQHKVFPKAITSMQLANAHGSLKCKMGGF